MSKKNHSISSDVGYLAAAFMAPRSFQKSMMERDAADQGIVTGLTMVLSYTVAAILQDGVEAATYQATKNSNINQKSTGLISSALAVGAGLVLQNLFQQEQDESTGRGAIRTAGYWLTVTGAAGALLQGLDFAFIDEEDNDESINISSLFILPIGVLIALVFDFAKYKKFPMRDTYITNSPARVAMVGGATVAILSSLGLAERTIAKNVQKAVDSYAKPLSRGWLPIGHLVSLGAILGASTIGLKQLYKKMESSQDILEQGFDKPPEQSFVSGERTSKVKWSTLSVQGRRHVVTRMPASKLNQDLEIKNAKEPIRLYVGLDSAPTSDQRVALALEELERTKAFDRKYLMLVAPTGTGYVNYVMSDTFEYLTKGDCAQITLQYSKRPSPLSLDMVDDGFIQFRMFINAVAKKLREMPANKRPKMVIFGESLGAWVSQDAFLHSGTDGLIANGIDYAIWIGTPELSKWQTYANHKDKLNFDHSLISQFDGIKEYKKLPDKFRKQLRYVMVTHYNDPVAHFSASLLIRSPKWLQRGQKRPTTLPKSAHYRTPTTFVQTAVDMKNALKPKPGIFTSHGHDYRADLLGFMNEVFEFNLPQKDLKQIDKLLVKNDKVRGNL
jgi:uncharacterized membrane protein